MASPPDSPIEHASISQSLIHDFSASNENYDIVAELESITDTVTLIDSESHASPISRTWSPGPPPLDVQFPTLYRHFHAILHDQADTWSLVAREATLLLSRELLTCPGTFQTIVTSLVFSEATVLHSVDLAIQKEHRLFSSTPMFISRVAFGSASEGLRVMLVSGLRGVAYSYLMRVWHAIVPLLCSPGILAFRDPLFSLLPQTPYDSLVGNDLELFQANTTWDHRFGYRFWHVWTDNDNFSWFSSPITRYLLQKTLVDMDSGVYINIPEVYLNQTEPLNATLTAPDLVCVSHRVAFTLAWIVVEMRALALSSYVFKRSTVLTPERAECVMNEITLINSFFDDIMQPSQEEVELEDATLAAIRYQRREALRQLLTLEL